MKEYKEDEYLLLSGIQHYCFCQRQWAFIHIEQQWKDNYFTIDGEIMHENAHNPELEELRKGVLVTRGMNIVSHVLGVRGTCDIVEFHEDENGVPLKQYAGTYQPIPVEYKRGKPKEHDADVLQLCAQAICLEEMLACSIPKGFLYYGATKRRLEVSFDETLRTEVEELFVRMHDLFERGHTPKGKLTKACQACSIAELCLPQLGKKKSVKDYMEQDLNMGE